MKEESAEDRQARLLGLLELVAHVDVRSHVGVLAQRVGALPRRHLQMDTAQYGVAFAHARTDDGGRGVSNSGVDGQYLDGVARRLAEVKATAAVGVMLIPV